MSIVLMYHALYRGGDTSDIDPEDRPYAVSENNFTAQLDQIRTRQVGLLSKGEAPDIVITFDDGHVSNLEIAAPLLQERSLSAYFFITSDFIGKRAGFLNADQLKQLSKLPGMHIGSHGMTHRFFDAMSAQKSQHELSASRQTLEQMTGNCCRTISFPGGRYNQTTLSQLSGAGYCQWFGSEPGILDRATLFGSAAQSRRESSDNLLEQTTDQPVNRVAVRSNTQQDEFTRMIEPDASYYLQHRRRRQAKNVIRQVIGNRLYHGLYKTLSSC